VEIKGKNIGFIITGSYCTFEKTIPQMQKLVKAGANVIPIMSEHAYALDTKFGKAQEHIEKIETITGNRILHTLNEVEPIGPKKLTDIMVIAPATGNTLGKLANGIIDTVATMATKSHLRNDHPVVVAISTNDGLSGSAENIGKLFNRRHYYFVPFRQDNPITKPRSLVFDPEYIMPTIEMALEGEQIQPVLL